MRAFEKMMANDFLEPIARQIQHRLIAPLVVAFEIDRID